MEEHKQDVTSRTSTKAKYRAMSVYLKHPTPLHCDNKSIIHIAHNSILHDRTKHIEINCHFTRYHL